MGERCVCVRECVCTRARACVCVWGGSERACVWTLFDQKSEASPTCERRGVGASGRVSQSHSGGASDVTSRAYAEMARD